MSEELEVRIRKLSERIEAACGRAHRDPATVRLVAVSKTFGPEMVRAAADAGLTVFGENKVQEAKAKIPLCSSHLTWHMVGHLQRNKVRLAVELFDMIHSVDSLQLAEAIHQAGDELGRTVKVLVEINVSGEGSKYGLKPADAPSVLEAANRLQRLEVMGLMTMPPFTEEMEGARLHFRRLRELRDKWREQTGIPLTDLSMGMTHDFEVAIEEGSTWIRVGTALFGERSVKKT